MSIFCSSYLRRAFQDFDGTVDHCLRVLEPHKHEFDAIAFRGVSGTLIAPIVASLMGKAMMLVRKDGNMGDSHAQERIEGWVKDESTYVILDDLISTGKTVFEIQQAIHSRAYEMKCVGIVLYGDGDGREWIGPPSKYILPFEQASLDS